MNRLNDYEVAENLITQLEQSHTDVTDNYNDWIQIGAALSTLGDNGRLLFHRISSMSPKYNYRECESKFNSMLRWRHNYTIGTLVHLCKSLGATQLSTNATACHQPRVKPFMGQASTSRIAMPAITTINQDLVTPTLNNHSGNNLFDFMASFYGYDTVSTVWNEYKTGTSTEGETIFWQHDSLMKCRSGKIMAYDTYGHRRRESNIDWVHSRLKIANFMLDQVFFGQHLVARHSGMVSIVESEKTALIAMCHVNPTCHPEGELFVASGGAANLTEAKVKALGYRHLRFYPDRDCQERWTEWVNRADIFAPEVEIMVLPDDSMHLGTKADYADLLLDWQRQSLKTQWHTTL